MAVWNVSEIHSRGFKVRNFFISFMVWYIITVYYPINAIGPWTSHENYDVNEMRHRKFRGYSKSMSLALTNLVHIGIWGGKNVPKSDVTPQKRHLATIDNPPLLSQVKHGAVPFLQNYVATMRQDPYNSHPQPTTSWLNSTATPWSRSQVMYIIYHLFRCHRFRW